MMIKRLRTVRVSKMKFAILSLLVTSADSAWATAGID